MAGSAIVSAAASIVQSMEDSEATEQNYNRLIDIVRDTFDDDRTKKMVAMYERLKDRLLTAPASSKAHYHNAYAGGYIEHVLHVYDIALLQHQVYKKSGGHVDYTKEELVFAALNHDLGKLGWDTPYYVPQDSKWHRETLGQNYKYADGDQYLTVNDITFLWLNSFGIEYTVKEMLGIKLADGNYDEGNKKYLMNNEPFAMRTALPYLVHWADHMATIAEKSVVIAAMEGE